MDWNNGLEPLRLQSSEIRSDGRWRGVVALSRAAAPVTLTRKQAKRT